MAEVSTSVKVLLEESVSLKINMKMEDIMHPHFLKLVNDHDIVGVYEDERMDRFSVSLTTSKHLIVKLSKELYEKLGIQGKKLDKSGHNFIIEINLGCKSMTTIGDSQRTRILNSFQEYFQDPLLWRMTCSSLAASEISQKFNVEKSSHKIEVSTRSLPIPVFPIYTDRTPHTDEIEELSFWLGCVVADCNIALSATPQDPFISVVKFDTPTRNVMRVSIRTDSIIHSNFILDILNSKICRKETWKYCCLRTLKGDDGFVIFLDPSFNFLALSCI